MFSYFSPDERVRKEHPLRAIRNMVDRALREMSPLFDEMYSEIGRPSIAPEKLLRTVATDAVFGTQRALVAGRDRLQCAVPLVRGNKQGRAAMGTRRCSRRIGIGCWSTRWRKHSSGRYGSRPSRRS